MLGQHTRVRAETLNRIVASSLSASTLASSNELALRLSLVNPACKGQVPHKPPVCDRRSLMTYSVVSLVQHTIQRTIWLEFSATYLPRNSEGTYLPLFIL